MMRTLRFIPAGEARRGVQVWRAELWDGERVAVVTPPGTFSSFNSVRCAAGILGLTPGVIATAFHAYRAGEEEPYPLDTPTPLIPPPTTPPARFGLRSKTTPRESATMFEDLQSALSAAPPPDAVIFWEGRDHTCALDLDFHGVTPPDRTDLLRAADTLSPTPPYWWITRGGGFRGLYHAMGDHTAEELAACAGLSLLSRFPSAKLELLSITRTPPAGEDIVRPRPTADCGFLRRLYGRAEAGDAAVAAWMEERDYTPGARYPHERCPVAPGARKSGNAPPVCVYEDHVYCYSCAAECTRRGSKAPGYFPLGVLCGSVAASHFRTAVENFTHWQHAKHIVAQQISGELLGSILYRAALRARHGDDPRIELVFTAGPRTGLIRMEGYWAGDSGRLKRYDKRSAVLSSLPCALRVMEGELKVAPTVVEELAGGDDLTPYGYPALVPIWGVHLTQHQDRAVNVVPVVRPSAALRTRPEAWPRYLTNRLPEEEAWGIIEGAGYPAVDRRVIELLITAKGCAEQRAGLPPMLFLTGPTGAGKTGSVNLAAAICGDAATAVQFHTEAERIRQGLRRAKQNGTFAFFDEYLKGAKRAKVRPDEAMEVLLSFTPESVSHEMYVGSVELGELPVCVWADTVLPPEVQSHAQIGRRVHHIPMREGRDWEGDGKGVRGTAEGCRAADAILSYIIDRRFPPATETDFGEVAEELGFHLLNHSVDAREKEEAIRRLYAAWEHTPAGKDGWRAVETHGGGELGEAWRALADARSPWEAPAVQEADLRRVLGLPAPVELQTRHIGGRLTIRFVGVGNEVESCAGEGVLDGSRNPIGGGLEEGGGAELPPRSLHPDHVGSVSLGWSIPGTDGVGSA